MAQVPSYQVPAHPSGLEMRTQLNAIILALIGDNAGPTPPEETYPGMWWGDTTASRLRRRNNANTAWVDLGPLDDFLSDIRTLVNDTAATKVNRSGDVMTGPLTLRTNLHFQDPAGANYGYVGAYGVPGQAGSGMGFVNAAFSAWNFQAHDNGDVSVRGTGFVSGALQVLGGRLILRQAGGAQHGEIELFSTDGTRMYMRGRTAGGGMEWVNDAYNGIPASLDNAGNFSCGGQMQSGNGGGILATNGDVHGGVWGGWLSNFIGNRAIAGAQVQHNSGIAESAAFAPGADNLVDMGNPWVAQGMRTQGGLGWMWLRCVWLRNQ